MEKNNDRLNPKNKQEAYCFQLEDDIRVLRCLALSEHKNAYNVQVDIMIRRLKDSKHSK